MSEQLLNDKKNSWKLFNRIAQRYDFLNHILSFGQDILWRRQLARQLSHYQPCSLLDIATGTADQLLSIHHYHPRLQQSFGLDMSNAMLRIAKEKLEKKDFLAKTLLVHGNALALPFQSNSVDAVSLSFGIRNVPDYRRCLDEIHRVLNNRGMVFILEFSLPQNRFIRRLYQFYFRIILPAIGGYISGNREAYRYLNKSSEAFPYGNAFCQLMIQAGFNQVRSSHLSMGVVTLYQGQKFIKSP